MFQFTANDITSIINKLDPNEAHSHDMISIRMTKLCGDSIYKPLEMIFKSCLNQGIFPAEWKKANVVLVHNKGDLQCVKNYRSVSVLSVFSKIFERLIYKAMFKHFLDSNVIFSNQSGFKPGYSGINQLIALNHVIFKGFEDGLEVRYVFLDISKAFNKVWQEGFIYKLHHSSICGNLLQLLINFLNSRKQRVLLNGQFSSWGFINAGVAQGSIIRPLLFFIYINDLTENLTKQVGEDLDKILEWAFQWKMSFNPDPSKQAYS